MTKAYFQIPLKFRNGYGLGSIMLKDDGKISISLSNGPFSSNEKFHIKKEAKQIVENNFNSKYVLDIEEVKNNPKLIQTLQNKMADFKKEYVEKCINWEEENFRKTKEKLSKIDEIMYDEKGYYSKEYYDFFGIQTEYKEEFNKKGWFVKKSQLDRKKAAEAEEYIIKIKSYLVKGIEYQKTKAEANAIQHFDDSLKKLANRLTEKGITEDADVDIKVNRLGLNLECMIIYQNINVKAWTIVAEGPIQRPHFRYLVR